MAASARQLQTSETTSSDILDKASAMEEAMYFNARDTPSTVQNSFEFTADFPQTSRPRVFRRQHSSVAMTLSSQPLAGTHHKGDLFARVISAIEGGAGAGAGADAYFGEYSILDWAGEHIRRWRSRDSRLIARARLTKLVKTFHTSISTL